MEIKCQPLTTTIEVPGRPRKSKDANTLQRVSQVKPMDVLVSDVFKKKTDK